MEKIYHRALLGWAGVWRRDWRRLSIWHRCLFCADAGGAGFGVQPTDGPGAGHAKGSFGAGGLFARTLTVMEDGSFRLWRGCGGFGSLGSFLRMAVEERYFRRGAC